MLLGSPQNLRTLPELKVKYRDHELSPVSSAKNLGIIFDRHLTWGDHITTLTKRCFGVLGGLSHLRGHLPPTVISVLVSALVISQVRYCIAVYGAGTRHNLSRIQKILNYAAKVIFGRKKYDHVSDLMCQLRWLSAENLVTYHSLCLLHKVRCHAEPEVLAGSLATVAEARGRDAAVSTRQDTLLHVPRSRTEMGKRRFTCRAPAALNSLPSDLPRLPPGAFGQRLRRHLLEEQNTSN